MREREVVISGIGLVTPLGRSVKENWDNQNAMNTGIDHYSADDVPDFFQYAGKIAHAAIPDDIPQKLVSQSKFLNRGSVLGFLAAREAVEKAVPGISDVPPGRRALYIASGDFTKLGYDFMYPAVKDGTGGKWQTMDYEKLNTSTVNKVNPFFLLESIHNNLFSFLSAYHEFMGPNTSLASLSPYGGHALELACRSIMRRDADIALAVGCGSWVNDIALYELEGLGILSKCRDGVQSFKPFDKNRDGFIPGEGGAAIFLEAAEMAERRGAEILARVKGLGNCIELSSDRDFSVPSQVSKRCIELTVKNAGCNMDDLSFIVPHGSATRKGDASELNSIMHTLGDNKAEVPICGMKPYTGHMGAASDIAEIILGIKNVMNRTVPATLNFEETEKEFRDLAIFRSPQKSDKNLFLSVSYGIGGQSSSAAIEVIQK